MLAGGLGTRLGPLTTRSPSRCSRLRDARSSSIRSSCCASTARGGSCSRSGYRGELIEEALGDGARLGLELAYVYDGPTLRGTAGAIRGALPLLGERFLVLYGDTFLRVDYRRFADFHAAHGLPGSMSVLHDATLVPANCVVEGDLVTAYDKRQPPANAEWVDYGLLAFQATVFAHDETPDLADVTMALAAAHQLAAFRVDHRFYEIGTPEALAETERFLLGRSDSC